MAWEDKELDPNAPEEVEAEGTTETGAAITGDVRTACAAPFPITATPRLGPKLYIALFITFSES